jgi:hypothetical protein
MFSLLSRVFMGVMVLGLRFSSHAVSLGDKVEAERTDGRAAGQLTSLGV